MSAVYRSMFLARWVVFLLRWILRSVYSLLQFISKPGSRYIVPLAGAVVLYWQRAYLHAQLTPIVDPITDYTTQAWMLDALSVGLFLLVTLAYVVTSRMLLVVLGAFPQIGRPLAPQHRLELPDGSYGSVPVTIVVPSLPRRRM